MAMLAVVATGVMVRSLALADMTWRDSPADGDAVAAVKTGVMIRPLAQADMTWCDGTADGDAGSGEDWQHGP